MNETKQHEVLWDLIKDTRFCMLSHRHTDGTLHSHPLTTQNKTPGADGCHRQPAQEDGRARRGAVPLTR